MNDNKRIRSFETVANLYSDVKDTPTATLGIDVEIQNPVFEDGTKGLPRLSCIMTRTISTASRKTTRFFRVPLINGDAHEIEAFFLMLRQLGDLKDRDGNSNLTRCQNTYDNLVDKTIREQEGKDEEEAIEPPVHEDVRPKRERSRQLGG